MLLFDVAVQASVGTVFALRDREKLTGDPGSPWATTAFRDALLYSVLLYIPSAIAFLYAWPGWNSMYLLDLERDPAVGMGWVYGDSVLLVLVTIAGFHWAQRWLRRSGSVRALLGQVVALWAVVGFVLVVPLWGRSFAVTSYDAFHAGTWPRFELRWGQPDSFFGRPIMWWLLIWAVIDFAPLAYLYWRGRRR